MQITEQIGLKDVPTKDHLYEGKGELHLRYCRWCKIWAPRHLRESAVRFPFNSAAQILYRVLLEVGKSSMRDLDRWNSCSFQHLSILSLALADLKDIVRFHSFSQDHRRSWISIESISPRLPGGKVITQDLIDIVGLNEVTAVALGRASGTITQNVLEQARTYFPPDKEIQVEIWSWGQ